jgi:hypothetical protein
MIYPHFSDSLLPAIPFIALYAEIHFRFFSLFPSFLYQRRPEIVFDMPRRLDPGRDLPIFLIVNDCNRFPCKFGDCSVVISKPGEQPKRFDFKQIEATELKHNLSKVMKVFKLQISNTELPTGLFFVNATITAICEKKQFTVLNDNFRTTSKLPFVCYKAKSTLPGIEFCSYGDLHSHSYYSQSHVEFGPPISSIDEVASATGLSFVAITDHSYDLACKTDNYLESDPELTRWKLFQSEFSPSAGFKTMMIPGEEVSCLNEKGEVVHLCALNIKEFLPGNLDGARKNRSNDPQLSLALAIARIHEQGGLAFAAHPAAKVGFLSRLFLRRGEWLTKDLQQKIDGMQILNSGYSTSWHNGKSIWISLLENGMKVPLLGGNDAHGDFNRYRAITTPFLAISEHRERYLGFGKTGVYGRNRSVDDLIGRIKNGETFVTTGPFAGISFSDSPADSAISHQPISSDTPLYVHAQSTQEFGALSTIKILAGFAEDPLESVVFSKVKIDQKFNLCEKIDLSKLSKKPTYIRAEVTCMNADAVKESKAFTSPVYFE